MDANEEPETVKGYLSKNKLTLRVVIDTGNKVLENYGVEGIPTFYVIGRDGKVFWKHTGAAPEELDAAVEKALTAQ